jgi:ribosomal protein S18 acetylase RimI-like enzyme
MTEQHPWQYPDQPGMAELSSFRLRSAEPADAPAVMALAQRVADFDPPPWRSRREIGQGDLPEITAYFNEWPEDSDLTIGSSDTIPVAGIVLTRLERDFFTKDITAHLSVIAVAAECSKQGLGTLLLRHAEDWAKSRGAIAMTLHVFDRNARAKALYQARGYESEMLRYRKSLT